MNVRFYRKPWLPGEAIPAYPQPPVVRKQSIRIQPNRRLINLWQKHEGLCSYCGRMTLSPVTGEVVVSPLDASLDHKIPKSRQGNDTKENITLACHECNALKGPLTSEEFLAVRHDKKLLKRCTKLISMLQKDPNAPYLGN